jgi:hypothetical protein
MSHRLRLTVPADHHVAFEVPAEITGEVEIVITPVAPASEPVSLEVRQRVVAIARKNRAAIGRPQTTDSTDLIREDRERE